MGYFSNGTEGMMWRERNCDKCRHDPDNSPSPPCPIDTIHMLFNYDQLKTGNEQLKTAMDMLIPPDKNNPLFAGQCSMFTPLGDGSINVTIPCHSLADVVRAEELIERMRP